MNMNFEEINKLFRILHKLKTVGVSEETSRLVNKEFDDPNNLHMFADAFKKIGNQTLLYEESPDQDLDYTKKILAAGIKPTSDDIRASIAYSDGSYKTAKLLLEAAKGTLTKKDINNMRFSSDEKSPQQFLMRWFFDAEYPGDEEQMENLLKLLLDHGLDVNKNVKTYLTGHYVNNDNFNNIPLIEFINDAANYVENPNHECIIKARDIIKQFLDKTEKKEEKKEQEKKEEKKEKVSLPSSKKAEGSKAATERAAAKEDKAKAIASDSEQVIRRQLPLVPGARESAERRIAAFARHIVPREINPQSRTHEQWVKDYTNTQPSKRGSLAEHEEWVKDYTNTQASRRESLAQQFADEFASTRHPATYQWNTEFPELNNVMDEMINTDAVATKSILETVLNISKNKSTLDNWVEEYTAYQPKGRDLNSRFSNAFRNVLRIIPNSRELTKLLTDGINRASIAANNHHFQPVPNPMQRTVHQAMPATAHRPILTSQQSRFTLTNPTRSNPAQMIRMGGKIFNPKTKRYVNAEGKIGKSLNNNKK